MENQALDLIDALYTLIAEAWGVPLGNDKCIIERDKALGLLDDLKSVLPGELIEARRLVNARNEFVDNTKMEVEEIRRHAEQEADSLVQQESVYRQACEQAEKKIAEAEEKVAEIRKAASQYLDNALRETEQNVMTSLETIRQARSQFRSAVAVEAEGYSDVTMEDVERVEDIDELETLD